MIPRASRIAAQHFCTMLLDSHTMLDVGDRKHDTWRLIGEDFVGRLVAQHGRVPVPFYLGVPFFFHSPLTFVFACTVQFDEIRRGNRGLNPTRNKKPRHASRARRGGGGQNLVCKPRSAMSSVQRINKWDV